MCKVHDSDDHNTMNGASDASGVTRDIKAR